MLKHYRFGFNPWGLVLFLVTMIPTIVWLVVPAPNDILRAESATPTVDAIGFVLQVLFVAMICLVVRKERYRNSILIVATIISVTLYFVGWILYYLEMTSPAVILLLSLPPCLAFIFYAGACRNLLALILSIGFTVCHMIYASVNFIL